MSKDEQASILVIDDTELNLLLLIRLLTKHGYRVTPASNGEEALAAIRDELPDLILLDIMMPRMDGYEVCQRLKADERTTDIPVIFISALDEIFDKMTAFSVGGVDYITKPFQAEEVLARVHTHLSLQQMRQTLQERNKQLREQNKELDAFAHTVAHDLKNPLAKISASLSFVQEYSSELGEEIQKAIEISVRTGQQMNSIINELLLLASVRKEAVKVMPVNMAEVVDRALNRLSQMLKEYQPELIVPEEWPIARGYAPWVQEVWVNYLSNGLKYGGQPPRLRFGATPQVDGTVRFWLQDNGPGLSLEKQADLFTEFTRLDSIRAQGHGLGLSIVRRIITKLGGQVGVESASGQGSLFYFTLPSSAGADPGKL